MATTLVMRASTTQKDRTKLEEGLRLEAYQDTEGYWTIGWGHAETNGIKVRGIRNGEYYEGPPAAGVIITPTEAQRLFDFDYDETERDISDMVRAPLAQNQFDCLCDFVHQFGSSALGGSTLISKINKNPNNLGSADNDTGILHELMRWTRAGGEHQEYVWRRSARRACVYAGTPIPQALWRKNGFPFAVNAETDKIDYSITPTIYKLIEYGKKAAEPYKFEPDKIKIEAQPQDELILDKPVPPTAEPSAAVSKEAAPAPATQPAPGSASPVPNTGVSKPASPGGSLDPMPPTPPKAPPVSTVPKPLEPPKPPPVLAPKTVDVRSIPYGEVAPENGVKNMSDSQRVIGMVIVGVGSFIQVFTTRLGVGGAIGAICYDLSRDPVVVALAATALVVVLGWVTRKRGTKVVTKGMVNAKHLLK